VSEIDQDLLESIKADLKDKDIEITENEVDETEYLLRSPANSDFLLRTIEDIESNKNVIIPDQEQFR